VLFKFRSRKFNGLQYTVTPFFLKNSKVIKHFQSSVIFGKEPRLPCIFYLYFITICYFLKRQVLRFKKNECYGQPPGFTDVVPAYGFYLLCCVNSCLDLLYVNVNIVKFQFMIHCSLKMRELFSSDRRTWVYLS
jgi:hypothetical protein